MSNIVYGYVRCSTFHQHTDRQIIALKEFGIDEKNIFTDYQSGKDFNRPQYQKLIETLNAGDTLVTKSIDRLGRNYDEVIDVWRYLTKEKRVFMVVLDMPLLDTRRKPEDIDKTFVADLVLQILSYLSHKERENMLARQSEGIAAAKIRGVHLGRPFMDKPELFDGVRDLYLNGEISKREAGRRLGVSRNTFGRWLEVG